MVQSCWSPSVCSINSTSLSSTACKGAVTLTPEVISTTRAPCSMLSNYCLPTTPTGLGKVKSTGAPFRHRHSLEADQLMVRLVGLP